MAKPLDNQSVPLALRVKAADAALEYVNALTLEHLARTQAASGQYSDSHLMICANRFTAEDNFRDACKLLAEAISIPG